MRTFFTSASRIMRLSRSFQRKNDKFGAEEQLADRIKQGERKLRPELSEYDKKNMEEIQKQIKDTKEPFKVQPRDPKAMADRPTKLNLKQFELIKTTQNDPNDPLLKRPKGVMDSFDPALRMKSGSLSFTKEE